MRLRSREVTLCGRAVPGSLDTVVARPECGFSVCVQDRRGRGQRGLCATLPTQALLSADITAALNRAAGTRSPRPQLPPASWHRAGRSRRRSKDFSFVFSVRSHIPKVDFSVNFRWNILEKKEVSFGFYIFCGSLSILGPFCGMSPSPGRIFFLTEMWQISPPLWGQLFTPQLPWCLQDFPGWTWVRLEEGRGGWGGREPA